MADTVADPAEEMEVDAESTKFNFYLKNKKPCRSRVTGLFVFLVSVDGIGPSTSVLSGQRSTTELHAQLKNYNKFHLNLQTSK